jgi:serine/threonine protein kinase
MRGGLGGAKGNMFSSIKQFLNKQLSRGNWAKVDVQERFDLVGTAGQGSMSKVYWARDRKLGRVVCVKFLDKQLTARLEASFKGMGRCSEGAICLAMDHPNIVKTYEHGLTTADEEYIVMEMIEGKRLDVLIHQRDKQLNDNRLNYLLQVCKGVDHIHQQKYVHWDICPRNVMVDHSRTAKIIDFGLSVPLRLEFNRPQAEMQEEKAREAVRRLTPYMDPILFKGARGDPRVDLFALGVTAYEILTGTLPWEKTEWPATGPPKMKDPRKARLEPDTCEFLLRAIDPDPSERFQTARQMQEALASLPVY